MDCKRVLVECDGDEEKAVEVLRKRGEAMADSRSGRLASDGLIVSHLSPNRDCGALLEVNCETDFVARGDEFRNFATRLGEIALSIGKNCSDLNVLNQLQFANTSQTVEEKRLEVLARIRENIAIRRFVVYRAQSNTVVGSYVHRGKMGILTELSGRRNSAQADDLAIHIAVKKPRWLDEESIPAQTLAKEKEIYLAQAREGGKPEFVMDRIVAGKVRKFVSESTLVGQSYYEDDAITVKTHLKNINTEVRRFTLFQLGKDL